MSDQYVGTQCINFKVSNENNPKTSPKAENSKCNSPYGTIMSSLV